MTAVLSRRSLLAAGGGLLVFVAIPGEPARADDVPLPGSLKGTPLLDAWIRIGPDGVITAFTGKAELGQGLKTALIQVIAEQLDIAPARVTLVTADTARTPNEGFTAGSHSMQDSGTALLNAAAQARLLLVETVATDLGVAAETLTVVDGVVHAPGGATHDYGSLAAKLSLHVRAQPGGGLKDPAAYRVMGTSMPRTDIPAKLTGGAAYVQDMHMPGMLHARAVRQPSAGATLLRVDTDAVARMPGVVKVVRDGSYLAVIAEGEWQAIKAMRTLGASAEWQETATLPVQADAPALIRSLPARDIPVLSWTNPAAPAVKRISARYTRPYQMHGAIGPSCALAVSSDDGVTVWTHTQGVFPLRAALAQLLGLPAEKVRCVHVEGSGCYGHNGADDVAADAALIARAVPGRPVRVQWMREQEHTSEPYGPAMAAEATGALDAEGRIVDWDYGVWSNTHNRRPNVGGLLLQNAALPTPLPVPPPEPIPMPEGGGERNSNPIYALTNARVVSHFVPEMPLRVSAMRALGAYLNVFAIESFMDELAIAAGADPVTFRLRHLTDERGRAVVQAAADSFGWGKPAAREPGHGRGFAFARYKNLGAYCAVALNLSVEHETGRIRLGRVVAAVDSGQPINPDGIRNQIEGAMVQAASWTLYEQVRFDRRHIASTDWSGYPIMRFPAAPESVEVHILPRPGQPFLGTGEAGQGPIAAAIANALHDAVGVRLRDLPLSSERVKAAIGV
ncbi:MAG TPA: molybdopterin cofactor-binding domain-containing protein [Acetobacteraceae bacterium]|jgi:nicotinate dehydrogenase subunit B|nr:molybdopterin cofactor-binding domain-containing protein [Acetobacteraceae bacterium]